MNLKENGNISNLPNRFPYNCFDLMQYLHDKAIKLGITDEELKQLPNYPKQTKEHSALSNSIFVQDLYYFLQNL